ncbi:MAG: hypothetical protein JXA52_10100 [Planctomycetes bacterium]|nr:hypothetical protein [Planctomycetota bacterium]
MKRAIPKQYLLAALLFLACLGGCGEEELPLGEPRPTGLITIDFASRGKPSVNGVPLKAEQIVGQIARLSGEKPKDEVIITIGEVAPNVLFETVLRVLDRLDKAGYKNVSISLPSETFYNR